MLEAWNQSCWFHTILAENFLTSHQTDMIKPSETFRFKYRPIPACTRACKYNLGQYKFKNIEFFKSEKYRKRTNRELKLTSNTQIVKFKNPLTKAKNSSDFHYRFQSNKHNRAQIEDTFSSILKTRKMRQRLLRKLHRYPEVISLFYSFSSFSSSSFSPLSTHMNSAFFFLFLL